METKRTPLYLGESSHTHRCAVCETDISCDSPEDPQGCMVNALTCGDCDDISQTLPSTGSGDYEPDDGFMPQDGFAPKVRLAYKVGILHTKSLSLGCG